MKLLLWITLGALAVTGGILWLRHRPQSTTLISVPQRTQSTFTNRFAVGGQRPTVPAKDRFKTPWEALNAGDHAAFVELLRGAGCPEETVRLFTIAAVGRQFQRRIEESQRAKFRASQYWRDEWRETGSNLAGELQRQRGEMNAALTQLLGASAREIRQDYSPVNEPQDWLSRDRRDQLNALLARQRTEATEIEDRGVPSVIGSTLDASLRAELKTLRERHRDELKQLLGDNDLAAYEHRDSVEASYVRQHMPQAKSEEEYKLLVRAARDIGFTEEEIAMDTMPASVQGERPALRKRILERFREISDPARASELQDAVAEANRQAEDARKAQQEASSLEDLRQLAKGGGVSLSDDEVRAFAEALRKRSEELNRELGDPQKLSDTEREALMQRLRVEMEQVAVRTLGDRGRAVVDQMWKEQNSRR